MTGDGGTGEAARPATGMLSAAEGVAAARGGTTAAASRPDLAPGQRAKTAAVVPEILSALCGET